MAYNREILKKSEIDSHKPDKLEDIIFYLAIALVTVAVAIAIAGWLGIHTMPPHH